MDDRAQGAIGIARLFLGLAVGAVIFFIVSEVTGPLFEQANQAGSSSPVAQTGTSYLQQGVSFLPVAFLLISFFGLVAYSVYAREVLG